MVTRYLTFIIIFQLLIPTHLFAADCGPGEVSSYGRCVKSTEQVALENQHDECLDADDRNKCYAELAEKKRLQSAACARSLSNDKSYRKASDDEKKSKMDTCLADSSMTDDMKDKDRENSRGDYNTSNLGKVGQAAVHLAIIGISIYAFMFWTQLKKKKIQCEGTPPSMYALSAAAAALLLTEIIAYTSYTKKLKERAEHLDSLNTPDLENDETSNDQATKDYTLIAYDTIIYQEKAYLQATKTRKTGYQIATYAFGAAGALVAYEFVANKLSKANTPTPGNKYQCGKMSKDAFKKISEEDVAANGKPAKKSVSPILLAIIPVVVGPLVGKLFSSSYNHQNSSEELYSFLNNPLDDKYELSIEKKNSLVNLSSVSNISELNTIIDERERLANGQLSSPSLKEFNEMSASFFTEDNDNFQALKQSFILSESFKDELEIIELFSDNKVTSL